VYTREVEPMVRAIAKKRISVAYFMKT